MDISHKNSTFNNHFLIPIIFILLTAYISGCVSQPTKSTPSEVQQLEAHIASNPNDHESHGKLADWYYVKFDETKDTYYRSKAITSYENFLELQPSHLGAAAALYNLQLDIAMNENYLRVRNKLREIYDTYPALNKTQAAPPDLIESLYIFGRAQNDTQLAQAREFALKAIKENPNHAGAHSLLGTIYTEQQLDDLAIASFKQSLAINPDNILIQKKLGNAYSYKAAEKVCESPNPYIDKSISTLKETLGKNLDDYESRDRLASLYEIKGLPQLAIYERKESLKLKDSNDDQAHLAGLYSMINQLDKAIEISTQITKKDSDYDWAWRQLGLFYFYSGEWQKSITAFQEFRSKTKDTIAYAAIMQSLASRQLDNSSSAREYLSTVKTTAIENEWERNLLRYFKGQLTDEQLKSRTSNRCETSEADFYIGYNKLLENKHSQAQQLFEKVLKDKVFYIYEYYAARYASQ